MSKVKIKSTVNPNGETVRPNGQAQWNGKEFCYPSPSQNTIREEGLYFNDVDLSKDLEGTQVTAKP